MKFLSKGIQNNSVKLRTMRKIVYGEFYHVAELQTLRNLHTSLY